MRKTQVGGQAVMEGVMMRGESGTATAVRTPKGKISIKFDKRTPVSKRHKLLSLPIIRGFVSLIDSLLIGINSLNFSASFFEEEEEPTKLEKWFKAKLGDKWDNVVLGLTLCLSLGLSVGLFFLLPTAITSLFKAIGLGVVWLNIIEAVIRIALFLSYIYLIGRMEDIKRLFQYHGAEHKTIFCYENEEELTVENVKKFPRLHPRCGTSFVFLVMIVSIIVFSFTGYKSLWQRFMWRILLLPLVSGITFEIIKWMGRSNNLCSRVFAFPGLQLQLLTTREPEDDQIEVAIASLRAAENLKETIGSLIDKGSKRLKEAHIDSYLLDTQLLLGKAINKDKLYIMTHREEVVSFKEEEKYYSLIKLREEKMPIKYILQECEFMGLTLFVKEGVLIPRGDTEILVEKVIDKAKELEEPYICDVCTGSGAIGIALASFISEAKVDCIDISQKAMEVTLRNIRKHNLQSRLHFIHSDLLELPIKEEKKYDIVVSNPPYIETEEINNLMEDVKKYEPTLALDGGDDGLVFYRRLTKEALEVLRPGGIIAFEIGYNQKIEVMNLLIETGYEDVESYQDLAGKDRVVIGSKPY